jgi:hypothetical protein
MRKTLLVVLVLGVALAFTGVVSAAESTSQPALKQVKKEDPYKGLDLTREQKKQIKSIHLQAKTDADKAVTVEEKGKIRKAADEKIRQTVLTEKQREQLAKNEKIEPKTAATGTRHKAPTSQPMGTKRG